MQKKYIEKATPDSDLQGKGSDIHKAAVVGDTVGDDGKLPKYPKYIKMNINLTN